MFNRIKKAFDNLSRKLSEAITKKELSEEEFEEIFSEFEIMLLEGDVAYDVVELLKENLKKELVGMKLSRFGGSEDAVKSKIRDVIYNLLAKGMSDKDLIDLVKEGPKPFKIVFLGVNGVGKTTTIAKVAYKLRKVGLRPVVVAADTFRAGAQEQLEVHARRLSVPFIKGKYGADPAAVAKDGVIHAEKNFLDAVLIDTAGRMHTDVDLMNEIRKVVRVVKPDMKVLVLDALTGNDAIQQAMFFDNAVGVDAVILTKLDADAKGGSALSIIMTVGKPILYVGVGQDYEDLVRYDPNEILNKLLEQ